YWNGRGPASVPWPAPPAPSWCATRCGNCATCGRGSNALELLRKLAREHNGVVGGSFLAKSGRDCFNSFLLVFPNGQYYRHDKDLPTMWEKSYYIGGSDEGVLATPAGPVGAALCWELIRSQTARRLVGKVNFVVGGS